MMLAFAYTLLTVIVALEVPLAINLKKRAVAELETHSLVQAQAIAASIGAEGVANAQATLQRIYRAQPGVRVIVVDQNGVLRADSAGGAFLGQQYVTPSRPELVKVADAGLGHPPTTVTRPSGTLGQEILATAAPILDENGYYGAVRVTESMAEIGGSVRRTTLGLIAIGVAGLVAGLFVAWLIAASLTRPLTKLADAARELGEGNLAVRAGHAGGTSEMDGLARSFDEMAERLQSAMRAQRSFVANASHQLRTPLTGMKLRIEAAMEEASGGVRRQLEAANTELDRLSRMVDDLLATSREREGGDAGSEAQVADLGQAVARAIERWDARAGRAGATLSASGGPGVAAAGAGDLDQILDNLIHNAVEYAPGPVSIETGRRGREVFLAVEDEGPGIRAEEIGLVTERFFRGRGTRPGGSGLGLAIVREIAERRGGGIQISNRSGSVRGARVEVVFPAASGLVGS